MQNDKKVKEQMTCFMMPTKAMEVSGIEEGDLLEITASEGKITIERVNETDVECDGDCENCPMNENECDGDCENCPCFKNCN